MSAHLDRGGGDGDDAEANQAGRVGGVGGSREVGANAGAALSDSGSVVDQGVEQQVGAVDGRLAGVIGQRAWRARGKGKAHCLLLSRQALLVPSRRLGCRHRQAWRLMRAGDTASEQVRANSVPA